jgi:hypothetical protein
MTETLYARGRVVGFVGEGLKRRGAATGQLPIMLLAGPHGSGGTALLDRLWEQYGPDSPGAHLDLASAQGAEDVVFAIMQGLRRRIRGIRPIPFPRLRLAFKALNFPEDGSGRAAFDAYMDSGGSGTAESLQAWVDRASVLLRTPEQQFLATVVGRTAGWLLTGFDHRGEKPALRWYAENGLSSGGTGYDPLWELFGKQRGSAESASRQVEKTLCAALLADLRADFNERSLLHGQRTSNCLVLLDNAGNKAGERLLDLLAECRRDAVRAGQGVDPALVVAALRGRTLRRAGTPIDTTDERLRFPGPAAAEGGWLPVRLIDLDAADVVKLTDSAILGDNRRDASFIHAATGGHPEAASLLAALLARPEVARADLPGLLDRRLPLNWEPPGPPVPGEIEARVADHLLRRIFPEGLSTGPEGELTVGDNALLDAMAVCTVTPGLRLGACQLVLNSMGWSQVSAGEVRDRLEEALWIEPPADGAEPRAHPLLDLLLRHWLARDAGKWRGVHQGYAAHYSRPEDAALRGHHTLALVQPGQTSYLSEVAKFLEDRLDKSDAPGWLRTLNIVTAAPNRSPGPRDPRVFVSMLAGPAAQPGDRRRVVARLAVARWLGHDRFFDPGRQLAQSAATELENLAQLQMPDGEAFFEESARWRRIEREWRN